MANPLGVDLAICLSLDLRGNLWDELAKDVCKRKWSNYKTFLVGKPERNLFLANEYDLIDTDELPPVYFNSTSYPTWHARPNAFRAFKAHQAMMRYCLDRDVNFALFIEDDSVLVEDFDEKIKAVENYMFDKEFDILYLGSYFKHEKNPREPVRRLQGNENVAGFHGVILSRDVMMSLSKALPIGPMDNICERFYHKAVPSFVCTPSLIRQRNNTFSYVENSLLEKPDYE